MSWKRPTPRGGTTCGEEMAVCLFSPGENQVGESKAGVTKREGCETERREREIW